MERPKELGEERKAVWTTATLKTSRRVRDRRLGVGAWARCCAAPGGHRHPAPAPLPLPPLCLALGKPPFVNEENVGSAPGGFMKNEKNAGQENKPEREGGGRREGDFEVQF